LLANYGLIGLFIVVAVLFSLMMVVIPFVLKLLKIAPSNPNPVKNSIFECGMETIGKTWVQFNFLALDVLVVFLYPWAVQLRQLGAFSFYVVLILVFIVLIGYVYAWKKKAMEWK
jgi:NADH-quinone oxidoreductase subunit A